MFSIEMPQQPYLEVSAESEPLGWVWCGSVICFALVTLPMNLSRVVLLRGYERSALLIVSFAGLARAQLLFGYTTALESRTGDFIYSGP